MSRVSKKVQKQITHALTDAFTAALKEKEFGSRDVANTPWYDTNPEIWLADEREKYDLLLEYQHQVEIRLQQILTTPSPAG